MRALWIALIALLLAPTAAAASPRSEAKRLLALDRAILVPLQREVQKHVDEDYDALDRCTRDIPKRAEDAAFKRGSILVVRRMYGRVVEGMRSGADRLDAFRSGNAKVRVTARRMARQLRTVAILGDAPPDLCGYFDAWRAAGWADDFRIQPPPPMPTAAERQALVRDTRAQRRTARRFRRWGVPRKAVKKWRESYGHVGPLFTRL